MRKRRIHRAGGLYYLQHSASRGGVLFQDAEDCDAYRSALTSSMRACSARLLAFSFEPTVTHLAVRVGSTPTSRIMSLVAQNYARAAHGRRGDRGAIFRVHYRALLVDDDYLAQLVRHIHRRVPLLFPIPDDRMACYSSHAIYLGGVSVSGVDVTELLGEFDSRTSVSRCRYARFISEPPETFFEEGFLHGLPEEPRAFGSASFLRGLGLDQTAAGKPTLAKAVRSVCLYCGVTEEQLASERSLSYARGLVVWYVEERRIGTLMDVARYFGRHWSTLRYSIEAGKMKRPELFDVSAIRAARPLIAVPAQSERMESCISTIDREGGIAC